MKNAEASCDPPPCHRAVTPIYAITTLSSSLFALNVFYYNRKKNKIQ